MSDFWKNEDEEVAALLDGRLRGRTRTKVIARAVHSDDEYDVLTNTAVILSEGDALLEKMQAPDVRAATRRAFKASPDALRKAAMEAARSGEG